MAGELSCSSSPRETGIQNVSWVNENTERHHCQLSRCQRISEDGMDEDIVLVAESADGVEEEALSVEAEPCYLWCSPPAPRYLSRRQQQYQKIHHHSSNAVLVSAG